MSLRTPCLRQPATIAGTAVVIGPGAVSGLAASNTDHHICSMNGLLNCLKVCQVALNHLKLGMKCYIAKFVAQFTPAPNKHPYMVAHFKRLWYQGQSSISSGTKNNNAPPS
eukprot:CAMPEP_0172684510 /NCGR_PEP_ID=MMETSP1074-20121228/19614_1 /TAXON_ID=2916 /ORGANISM="Ceratium fusus, Strain PA161109" /LENGTH=110 /DNA_ID=CAMNT_0013503531 /DNA_START=351 /DNA_END=682 /DNA_ORIENTATION=+